MDSRSNRLSAIGVVILTLAGAFFVWDWSHYSLPNVIEEKLHLGGYDPFAPAPRRSVVSEWIETLRSQKRERTWNRAVRVGLQKEWERFEAFEFGGAYLSCENADEGRWFVHFEEEGSIGVAVPGDMRFIMDSLNPEFPEIDLGEIFGDSTTYRRVDGRTMEFSNETGIRRFSISPKFNDTYPFEDALPTHLANHNCIRFEDLDRPGFRFELWRDEVNASKYAHFRKAPVNPTK